MNFKNEIIRDFSTKENQALIQKKITELKATLPVQVQSFVNGEPCDGAEKFSNPCPSNFSCIISNGSFSEVVAARRAIETAVRVAPMWAKETVSRRVGILKKAAQLMHDRKDELCAVMVMEVSKNFREADADLAEAVDFCNYYAEYMEALSKGKEILSLAGEKNEYFYKAKGLAVAIAPWNFPLAILCGMTVAPLVAGNPVIMKPAEQSPLIALKLYEILREAGTPAEVLHLLIAKGEDVGRALVEDPRVHIISFTGSRAVGLAINTTAAQMREGQKHVKKVIAEMGGKNAMIIDESADLDEAVLGAMHSAFGFQGQKCSALSRLIVLEEVYENVKKRLIEAMKVLTIGPAENTDFRVGPVIDTDSQRRLLSAIDRNKSAIVYQCPMNSELLKQGAFVPPTLFESSNFHSELAQDEFFGPLICLFKVKTLDEAFEKMNDVDYALTGGIFSRSPKSIERARQEIEVGNLYINRGITGALVGRQPFGGYKLSGVGAKAGGPDYLLQFLEPYTQTENTMRRGFAPESA